MSQHAHRTRGVLSESGVEGGVNRCVVSVHRVVLAGEGMGALGSMGESDPALLIVDSR